MKRIYSLLVALVALTMTANAQLSWGVEGGFDLNKLDLSSDLSGLSANNRAGFFIGPKVKFTVPLIGVGVDGAILYNNKGASFDVDGTTETKSLHYINVPINLRYQIGLGSLAAVYVATGPQWNWNIGDKSWDLGDVANTALNTVGNLESTFESSSLSWNIGVGAMLFTHLQIGVTYNIPITKSGGIMETVINNATQQVMDTITGDTKNNTWQIRAAYYF